MTMMNFCCMRIHEAVKRSAFVYGGRLDFERSLKWFVGNEKN